MSNQLPKGGEDGINPVLGVAILLGLIVGITGIFWVWFSYAERKDKEMKEAKRRASVTLATSNKPKGNGQTGKKVRDRRNSDKNKEKVEGTFKHKWLMTTLKGHSGRVSQVNFSPNYSYLASIAEDRTVLIWLSEFFKTSDHKQFRLNTGLDCATRVTWSPDNKAIMIAKEEDKILEVHNFGKRYNDEKYFHLALSFKSGHKMRVVGLGISSKGNFMMSCSSDGRLAIWDLRGVLKGELHLGEGLTTYAQITSCGTYVAACGKYRNEAISEFVIYSVHPNASRGDSVLIPTRRIPGFKDGIYGFDFSLDSKKLITVGYNCVWRIMNIGDYNITNDSTGTIPNRAYSEDEYPMAKFTSDLRIVAITAGTELLFISVRMGKLLISIDLSEPIRGIAFTENNFEFLTYGDRYIRIFHNVSWIDETRVNHEAMLQDKNVGKLLRDRLKSEIERINEYYERYRISQ